MEQRIDGKRILALVLAVVMALSMLPANAFSELLAVKAAAATESIVLFDDALSSIVTAHHESLTVADDPKTAGNKVLQLGNNYARLFLQTAAGIDLTAAKANGGKLIFDFYSQSDAKSLDVYILNDVNDTYTGQEFKDFQTKKGWTTVEIPVADITAGTICGVSFYTGIWTQTENGVYNYVDNVRIEWGSAETKTIQISAQPVSAEVKVGEEAQLGVTASLSDGGDTPALQYQWYKCDDADKTNAVAIPGATAAAYTAPTATAGVCYYYCQVKAEGLEAVDSDVAMVTVVEEAELPGAETLVIFDDAFVASIKTGDMSNVTVTANIAGPDGKASSVIALGGGWSLSRFGTGANPIDITQIVAASGNLVFDIYASYATTDSVIRVYTAAWQGKQTVFTRALNTGWNTVTIPAAEIGSTDFYGIGILSHTGTCYVDNVRFEWAEVSTATIRIDTQPVSAEVKVGEEAQLCVAASLSNGGDTPALQYQWYKCDDADKTNAVVIPGATAAAYTAPTATAGVCYYYCQVKAEGLEAVDSGAVSVTVTEPEKENLKKQYLFQDDYADGITGQGASVTDNCLKPENGWAWMKLNYTAAQDWSEAFQYNASLSFEIKSGWFSDGDLTKVCLYANGNSYEVTNAARETGKWNKVAIPLSEFGITDFTKVTGVGIMTYGGATTYVDNVCLMWEVMANTIALEATVPSEQLVQQNAKVELKVEASVSDGSQPLLQWYQCKSEAKEDTQPVEGATATTFLLPETLSAGTYYYYCTASAEDAQTVSTKAFTVRVGNYADEGTDPESNAEDPVFRPMFGEDYILSAGTAFQVQSDGTGTYLVTGQNASGNWSQEFRLTAGAFNGKSYSAVYAVADQSAVALKFRVRFPQGAQQDLLYRISVINPAPTGKEDWRTVSFTVDFADKIDMNSKDWQQIEIPMSAFTGSASYWDPNDANADQWGSVPVEFDWSNIIGVSFTQTVPANVTKDAQKTMLIDSVAFAKASPPEPDTQPLTADRWIFEDALLEKNSLVNGPYPFKISDSTVWRGTHALAMAVENGKSASAQIKLMPKMSLSTQQMYSAALRFWVKLPGDGGVYNVSLGNDYSHVEAYATASVTVDLATYVSTKQSGWQQVVIPLSDFQVQAKYWSNSQRKLVNCDFDFSKIDSISVGCTAKKNATVYVDNLYFDYGYYINNNGKTDDLKEDASVLQMVFGDSFGTNTLIKGQYNYRITPGNAKTGNAKLEITHPWDNAEWYVRFPKALDLSDEEIFKSAAVEFWVKLNGEIGWYNCYLFNQRGPGKTNLGRTSVSINDFVNKKKIGEWQKVQIPLSYFTTNGQYVDDKLQLQDWEFDFSSVVGIGMAQLAEKGAPTDPLVMYDDVKITLGNLPDTTYGVQIISPEEFEDKNITFTKLDLRPYMTTGFADQTSGDGQGGWTDQGSTNDLSAFTLRGEQVFEHIPFDIVEPNENNGKSVIALRQFFGGVFTDEVTIPVGQKAAGFYVIHAFSYDDSLIATYTFRYTDGTEHDVQILKNRQIYNWWGNQESDVVRLIWSGENPEASTYNMPISLGMFPCENPFPDKQIESIRLRSETEDCAAMVLAITLADQGLYLPERESIYNPDTSDWYVYQQPDYEKVVGSALDVSYVLDGPAGNHGFVQIQGENFVFEDGTVALFWGTNNGETSTFQSHDEIDRYVDVLAASGMNMVRLMDIDGGYFRPNIFGFNEDNMTVDEEAMDSLCYFWAKCKEKGIYIQFCLTGVRYPSKAMNHPAYEDLAMGFKTEIYFDKMLMDLTKDLAETILTWENPYTGTTLATDPCVAMIEINNESNLVNTFGSYSGTAYEITSEYEKQLLKSLFNAYLKELYGTNEELVKAWTSEGKVALRDGENLDDGSIVLDEQYLKSNFSRKRVNDSFAFLYKLQSEYHGEMIRWLKEDLGVKVPITGTQNLPSNDRADIYENAHFDYLARHQYESHPQSGTEFKVGAYSGSVNSIILNPESSSLAEDAARRVTGIPYIVNEFQMSEPNMYISEFYLVTSAIFSYHGWSGLNFPFTTAEMDDPVSNKISDFFQVMGHPLRYGTLASASLLYHRNEIAQAEEGYYTSYTEKDALNATNQSTGLPENSFIVGSAGINMESATGVTKESSMSALEKINHQTLVSENGEIIWTPDAGHFFLNTTQTQAAAGTLAGQSVSLSDVEIATDNYFASITVSALGMDVTIANAQNILITAAARARNTGAKLSADGKTIQAVGEAPILVEQVEGTVTIKNTNTYDVYILNTSGERIGKASSFKDENGYTVVEMKLGDNAMHYELVKVADGQKTAASQYGDVSDSMAAAVETAAHWLPALTDGFYGLGYDVERGDFTAALVREFGLTAENANTKYGDVEDTHQGASELKIAKALKLVTGTRLEPYASMTRADAWMALYNAMTAAGYTLPDGADVGASVIEDYASLTGDQQIAVSSLIQAELLVVTESKKLAATETMSRREAVLLLAAAAAGSNGSEKPGDSAGKDKPAAVWYLILGGAVLVAGAGAFGAVACRKKKKQK